MNKQYAFGDLVYGYFPFADADAEKARWVMVLADKGPMLVVAYLTTNPHWPRAVALGPQGGGKACHLVAYRWEAIQKERILEAKGVLRAPLDKPEVLGAVGATAKIGRYAGYSEEILAEVRRQAEYADARAKKKAAKLAKRGL